MVYATFLLHFLPLLDLGVTIGRHAVGGIQIKETIEVQDISIKTDIPIFSHHQYKDVAKDVDFLLWTRQNPENCYSIQLNDSLPSVLSNSSFSPSVETKILIHGYGDTGDTDWIIRVKDKYLKKGNYNVISVDWRRLANTAPFYNIAAANTKPVGYLTADLITYITQHYDSSDIKLFHPIGFSLGAHVAGHAGYHLNGELSRITGLDPAGFLFHTVPKSEKLSTEDAKFVDVIHSAGLWIGTDEVVGHVDFYPNGGMAPQPDCKGEPIGLDCSHQRANKLFEESIDSQVGFHSVLCDSWQDFESGLCDNHPSNMMGEPATKKEEGVFYLATNAKPPYAIPPRRYSRNMET